MCRYDMQDLMLVCQLLKGVKASNAGSLSEVSTECLLQPVWTKVAYIHVQVDVSTHAAGGITSFDFELAKKLDELEVDYSPKWLRQQQEKAAN